MSKALPVLETRALLQAKDLKNQNNTTFNLLVALFSLLIKKAYLVKERKTVKNLFTCEQPMRERLQVLSVNESSELESLRQ